MTPALHWCLQRISGALLLVLLVAHFWVEHFAIERLSFAAIESRVRSPLWQAIDISFLVVALYHGLSGLRNILLDFSVIPPAAHRVIAALLIAAGALWTWWGVSAFRNL